MKLEFETASKNSFNQYQLSKEIISKENAKMLDAGVQFAKEGNRFEARRLFLLVTDTEPENERAWIELASISEYPEELIAFLHQVLKINPRNEQALERLAGTRSSLAQNFIRNGIGALRENRRDFARQCFLQTIVQDSRNETARLGLAALADSAEEKTFYFGQILDINPANETALSAVESIERQKSESLLKKAYAAAAAGERENAAQMLEEVLEKTPDLEEAWILNSYLAAGFQEKIACYEKILLANPESEAARVNLILLQSIMQKSVAPETEVKLFDLETLLQDFSELSAERDSEQSAVSENFSGDKENKLFNATAPPISSDNSTAEFNNKTAENAAELALPNDELNFGAAENQTVAETEKTFGDTRGENSYQTEISKNENELSALAADEKISSETMDCAFEKIFKPDFDSQFAPRRSEEQSFDEQKSAAGKSTIMIVDSSATIRKLVCGKLEQSGHTVVAATGGKEALEKINEVTPDLVLLDISMPEMNGYEICKHIRSNQMTKDIPILLIAGKEEFFDKARAQLAGSTGFISKPFGPDTLMRTIETYLQ